MDSMTGKREKETKGIRRPQANSGFTLIETIVAVVILSFGILSLAATMADSIAYMNGSQADYIAQQKAEEGVESVFFARDSKLYTWAQIENASNGGIFLDGPAPLLHPGANGIVGTIQDQANNPDVIVEPGPDGVLGTADDIRLPLSNFTRQIVITDVPNEPNLRQIQITIQYTAGRFRRQYTLTSYISAFS
jgi:prepilin-type N-terminal cleavage/methylation domain-containing protein